MQPLMIRKLHAALLVLPLLAMGISLKAQGPPTVPTTSSFEEASRLMEENFYGQAAMVWKDLLAKDPDNANLNWKVGEAYMLSYNEKAKALPYLEVASAKRGTTYGGINSAGYNPFDPKERNAPPKVDYWLGKAYHLNNEFDKADAAYAKFIAEAGDRNDYKPMAVRGLEETANARKLMASPNDFEVSNIGQVINAEYPDFSPVISVDG